MRRRRPASAALAAALALALAACGSSEDRGADAARPEVVAVGDVACDPNDGSFNDGEGLARNCRQKHTAALTARIDPDAILGLGDSQYEYGTLENFRRSYDRSWGRFNDITYTTAGSSHDFYGGGDWYRYFGERAGPEPYKPWSFDLGAWHIISMNSNCWHKRVGGCDEDSPQYRWLQQDLQRNQGRCIAAMWHDPRFASASRQGANHDTAPFVELLYAARADILLAGHAHNYERFAAQTPDGRRDNRRGIVQFVVGTGGKSLDGFEDPHRNSVARNGREFGVLRLKLHPRSYDFEFVPERSGGFTDEGSRMCNAFRGATQAPAAALRLGVRPRRARAGQLRTFRFSVTTVSDGRRTPVAGATVRFAGRRARTGASGVVRIRARARRPGLVRARATSSAYRAASTRVRFLRPRRR